MVSPEEENNLVIDSSYFLVEDIPQGEEVFIPLFFSNRWMTWELCDELTIENVLDYYTKNKEKYTDLLVEWVKTPLCLRISLDKLDAVARHYPTNTIYFLKAPIEPLQIKEIYAFLTDFYTAVVNRRLLTPIMTISTRISFNGDFKKTVPLEVIRNKFSDYVSYEPELSLKQLTFRSQDQKITLLISASGSFSGISSGPIEETQEYVNRVFFSLNEFLVEKEKEDE